MPIIELKCIKCGHKYEEIVAMGADYPKCPKCGGTTEQVYNGKLTVNYRHADGCNGDCKCCGGCKH